MSILDIMHEKKDEISSISNKYGVSNIQLFGSVARKEDTDKSDIDILIELEDDRSLFDLIGFKYSMEELLNKKVDVVTIDSLHETIREKVLRETVKI